MKIDVSSKLCDIIIPTKNRATYLNRCLDSIYNATSFQCDFFNIIVSDNNSTDDTDLILNKFCNKSNFYFIKRKCDVTGWENSYDLLSVSQSKFVLVLSDHVFIEDHELFDKILLSLKNNFDLYFIPAVQRNVDLKCINVYSKINFVNCLFISQRFYFISGQIISRDLVNQKIETLKFNAYLFFYFYILNLNKKNNIIRINSFLRFESFSMQNRSWQYGDDGLLLDKLNLITMLDSKLIRYFLIFKLLVESKSVIPHIGLLNYKKTVLRMSPKLGPIFYCCFSFTYYFKSLIKLFLSRL